MAEMAPGSRCNGYESYLIKDLVMRPVNGDPVRQEWWLTPDDDTSVAPLPAGIDSHFGPELHRFVLP